MPEIITDALTKLDAQLLIDVTGAVVATLTEDPEPRMYLKKTLWALSGAAPRVLVALVWDGGTGKKAEKGNQKRLQDDIIRVQVIVHEKDDLTRTTDLANRVGEARNSIQTVDQTEAYENQWDGDIDRIYAEMSY